MSLHYITLGTYMVPPEHYLNHCFNATWSSPPPPNTTLIIVLMYLCKEPNSTDTKCAARSPFSTCQVNKTAQVWINPVEALAMSTCLMHHLAVDIDSISSIRLRKPYMWFTTPCPNINNWILLSASYFCKHVDSYHEYNTSLPST